MTTERPKQNNHHQRQQEQRLRENESTVTVTSASGRPTPSASPQTRDARINAASDTLFESRDDTLPHRLAVRLSVIEPNREITRKRNN